MRTGAKGKMFAVIGSVDIELLCIPEMRRIPARCSQNKDHLIALSYSMLSDMQLLSGNATGMMNR